MMVVSVTRPAGCDIPLAGGLVSHGVDQDWYPSHFRRQAGCGPSTASNMLRYLKDRLHLPFATDSREDMQKLMALCWDHVTPGLLGLNKPARFAEGMDAMLARFQSPMRCRLLTIPRQGAGRPDLATLTQFIADGILSDCPVAFLNLHNGGLSVLENWHWVTVMGLSDSGGRVMMDIIDNGLRFRLDLGLWLKKSTLGGGFVYCV